MYEGAGGKPTSEGILFSVITEHPKKRKNALVQPCTPVYLCAEVDWSRINLSRSDEQPLMIRIQKNQPSKNILSNPEKPD